MICLIPLGPQCDSSGEPGPQSDQGLVLTPEVVRAGAKASGSGLSPPGFGSSYKNIFFLTFILSFYFLTFFFIKFYLFVLFIFIDGAPN